MMQRKYLVKALAEYEVEVAAESEAAAKAYASLIHPKDWNMEDWEIYNIYDLGDEDETAI